MFEEHETVNSLAVGFSAIKDAADFEGVGAIYEEKPIVANTQAEFVSPLQSPLRRPRRFGRSWSSAVRTRKRCRGPCGGHRPWPVGPDVLLTESMRSGRALSRADSLSTRER